MMKGLSLRKYHVIFHSDEAARSGELCVNTINLLNDMEGEQVIIEVLVNGRAVGIFQDNS